MPIYEFYCSECHRIYNFLSRSVQIKKRPDCPQCGKKELAKQVSLFAISRGREEGESGELPDIDEAKMAKVMESMAGEVEGMDEEDPRQAAQLMRKLYDATGLNLGPGMEEAIHRMEAGEDPDRIEEELGDLLENEDPFSAGTKQGTLKNFSRKILPPSTDDTLYEM
ncbi:MAG: zinc ribbon domain-containing protein [Deltaproteobacteria bacterium]|nr:zinc ribbon domain-containing protein [Deltaproteobacteria bacterium]